MDTSERGLGEHHSPILALFVVLELVFDHVNHDIVRDQTAGIHDLLGFNTEGGLLCDLLTKHITSGQVANTELVTNPRSLCALA